MNWTTLKTEEEYKEASNRLMEIFHAEPNTLEYKELSLLILLVQDYEEKHYKSSLI